MKITHTIETDMLVQASGNGPAAYLGRVTGLKKRYLKLGRKDMPDGKRRYIPLDWVKSVNGNTVHLSQTAAAARSEWLTRADLKDREVAKS